MGVILLGLGRDGTGFSPSFFVWLGRDGIFFFFFVGVGRERFENSLPCHPLVWVCYYNSNEFTFKSWRQIHISLKQHSEEQIVPCQWDNNIWFPIKCSVNKTQNRKIANRCAVKVNYTKSFLFISVILFRFLHCPKRIVLSKTKVMTPVYVHIHWYWSALHYNTFSPRCSASRSFATQILIGG